MLVLTIRTDKPEAELGLFKESDQIDYHKWQAHRRLSETIHQHIDSLLKDNQLSLNDLNSIVVYKGPGSFTGLRIGLSVANALAYGLGLPIISASGQDWIRTGIKRLKTGDNEKIALPHYGALPHITKAKK